MYYHLEESHVMSNKVIFVIFSITELFAKK